jgi:ribosome-associated protein
MKNDFRKIAQTAARAADDKKAVRTIVLDLRKSSDVADFIVIAGAESTVQIRAIGDSVEESLENLGVRVIRREGQRNDRWMVLDYGGMVMHILSTEAREFYRLEQMWDEAQEVAWAEEAEPAKPKAKSKSPVKKTTRTPRKRSS